MAKAAKPSKLHACYVLKTNGTASHLWGYSVSGEKLAVACDLPLTPQTPLPARQVGKDWRNLWQRKVNVAWLPLDQVFLRVVHLPTDDLAEVPSMVELQLEKLSPLPVAQIVWSYELLPQGRPNLQTAVVIIVARSAVEDFLGEWQQRGYLVDRLELAALHHLVATRQEGDGTWVFPERSSGRSLCLLAWWYGGVLHSLSLVPLPEGEPGWKVLSEEIARIAWAGEIEGWLQTAPQCHLVVDAEAAATWEPVLREATGQSVTVTPALSAAQLAALNVTRLAKAESHANLLPPEFATRYRQQFIDRLWMRGLGAAILVYLIGVLVYFAALEVRKYQLGKVEEQIVAITPAYTNALQLRARVEVMQEQNDLKYAALDSWKAAVETLPTELILRRLTFQRGQRLSLAGVGAGNQVSKVTDYTEALSKMTVDGSPMFTNVTQRSTSVGRGELGPETTTWSIDCELRRSEL